MATDMDPIVGNWYRNLAEKSQRFEVVSLDEDAGVLEVQHFDGDVEEWDIDQWYLTDLETIEPPEDWTGPIDDETTHDELVYSPSDMGEDEWDEPYREAPKQAAGPDEEYGGDEWGEEDTGGEEEESSP